MVVYTLDSIGRSHTANCLISAVPGTMMNGLLIVGLTSMQSGQLPPFRQVRPWIGLIYGYHALICPMETISRRQSAWHNFISGATIGTVAVMRGHAGVPFVPFHVLYRYPFLPPAGIGGVVYGSCACLMSIFGGKRF